MGTVTVGIALQLVAVNIRRHGKQPGGKTALPSPPAQSPPRPHQRFLRQLLRAAAVAAIAPRHVYQRSLPAPHNPLKCARIPGQHALPRRPGRGSHWLPVRSWRVHAVRQEVQAAGCILFPARSRSLFPAPGSSILQPHLRRPPVVPAARGQKDIPQQGGLKMTHLLLNLFFKGDPFSSGNMGMWIFLSVGAVALFVVFIPLVTWIESRRKEREAFYQADTMRRLTESHHRRSQGSTRADARTGPSGAHQDARRTEDRRLSSPPLSASVSSPCSTRSADQNSPG